MSATIFSFVIQSGYVIVCDIIVDCGLQSVLCDQACQLYAVKIKLTHKLAHRVLMLILLRD